MGLAWDDGWTIPFDAPYYPALPVVYRSVEFQSVFALDYLAERP